jgi:hypothetical protein
MYMKTTTEAPVNLEAQVMDDLVSVPLKGRIRFHSYTCRDARADAKKVVGDFELADIWRPNGEDTLGTIVDYYVATGTVRDAAHFAEIADFLPCTAGCLPEEF